MKQNLCMVVGLMLWLGVGAAMAAGDGVYSVEVTGKDGVVYHCKPALRQEGGKTLRDCKVKGAVSNTVFGAGTAGGIAALAPLAGGIAVLGAIASDSDSGAATTASTQYFKR